MATGELIKQSSHDNSKTSLGFWIYLMTDCILFACLFATYAVLRNSTANGPDGKEIFDLRFSFIETMILLTSSFATGLAILSTSSRLKKHLFVWLGVTFLLGISFLTMEINEFAHLANQGFGWQKSAFLLSYYALVGTHGLHITAGLIWLVFLMFQIYSQGLNRLTIRRLALFGLFWHFLDIIWIFIFTLVYLRGVI